MKTRNIWLLCTLCLSCLSERAYAKDGNTLAFFIVGDAHVGWNNKMQPTLAKQRENLRTILAAFPDLDFFMDAGDNTHPDVEAAEKIDAMRKNWMALEPNACVGIPFLYTAGNHEVMHWQNTDPESECAVLGSAPCRPYYSVTRKGIHIISLPELSNPVFLTDELLDWLRLDLAAHIDQTTIIVSHNSILNTTGNDTPGYRGLVQSGSLLELFKRNPQVIAWMHGHNHDYAVVERNGMLFVSVGRFGGFSQNVIPAGGIYVEVTPAGITARGYNAETGKFLEGNTGNLNQLPVSGSVTRQTSLDAGAKTEACFGVGRDQEGSKIAVFNHYVGGTASAFLAAETNAVLNDNPDFSLYAEREVAAKGTERLLFGYDLRVRTKTNIKVAPGGLFMEWKGKGGLLLAPDLNRSRGYYHVVPGKPYCATMDLSAPAAGGTLTLSLLAGSTQVAANPTKSIAEQKFPLKAGRGTYELKGVMKTAEGTTYSDPDSNVLSTIAIQAIIEGINAVTIHSFTFSRADVSGGEAPALVIGGTRFAAKVAPNGLWSANLGGAMREARTVVETGTGGCSSWLISKCDIDWQVRNAAVSDKDKSLVIESIQNPWCAGEILIAPLFITVEPFLAKTKGVLSLEIFPINRGNKTLRIGVREANSDASLTIKSAIKPRSVNGALTWNYQNGFVQVSVQAPSTVTVEY